MRTTKEKKRTKSPPGLPAPISKEFLSQPLSDIFNHLLRKGLCGPVRDLEGWVRRSPNARIDEAQEKEKKPLPMNAFMLYRFAYHGLVKDYFSRKNHSSYGKTIARIIRLGWRSEPKAVRRRFEDLASIERHNYLTLHPKANQSIAKRRQQRKKRAPSLNIISHAEVYSSVIDSEGGQDSESEMSSPSSEESDSWLDPPNNSTRLATCDCRATSEVYPSPWLLGETLGEIGNLRALGFENNLSGEPESGINSDSQCPRYIDPRLLTCGDTNLRT